MTATGPAVRRLADWDHSRLEALAEEQGIDTDAVLTDAAIEEAEDRGTGGDGEDERED